MENLTSTEIEFKAMCSLLIGKAVIDISNGQEPHGVIEKVIIDVLKWLHSKEDFDVK